jgi:hypothetical protein
MITPYQCLLVFLAISITARAQPVMPPEDIEPPHVISKTEGTAYQSQVAGLSLAVNTHWQSAQRYGKIEVEPLLFTALQLDSKVIVEGVIALFRTTRANGESVVGTLHCHRHPYAHQDDDWQFNWSPNLAYDGTATAAGRREYKNKVTIGDLYSFIDDSKLFLRPSPEDQWLCVKVFEGNWIKATGNKPAPEEIRALLVKQQPPRK